MGALTRVSSCQRYFKLGVNLLVLPEKRGKLFKTDDKPLWIDKKDQKYFQSSFGQWWISKEKLTLRTKREEIREY